MARSRGVLGLAALVVVGAVALAAATLGIGTMADGRAETIAPTGPTGPLRDRALDGEAHPVPDGMELAFEEEFGDDLDDDVWGRCHWWQSVGCTIESNDELELYLPDNVDVADGVLRLEGREEEVEDKDGATFPYTSGMISTGPPAYEEPARRDFTYGYVEARLRLPQGQGLWPAFWLLPSSQESRPEIDVIETLGHDPARAEMHYHAVVDDEEVSVGDDQVLDGLDDGDWHTFAVDWSPGRITWVIDGAARYEVTGEDVSDEAMYLVLNLAVGGTWPGAPDETTDLPALVEADWIRVWQDPLLTAAP
jgi:beta-glucanase (GH16 family)